MARRKVPVRMIKISSSVTEIATVAVYPSSSGWKAPLRPANRVDRRIYVTSAIVGMYMSGELMSSRGGR